MCMLMYICTVCIYISRGWGLPLGNPLHKANSSSRWPNVPICHLSVHFVVLVQMCVVDFFLMANKKKGFRFFKEILNVFLAKFGENYAWTSDLNIILWRAVSRNPSVKICKLSSANLPCRFPWAIALCFDFSPLAQCLCCSYSDRVFPAFPAKDVNQSRNWGGCW